MEAGTDVYTAMREVRVPEHLDVGEGYGKTSWNVRAIWEMYAGWFQHRSTTELYGVAPRSIAADVVTRGRRRRARRGRPQPTSTAGAPCEALQLTDLVLAVEPRQRRGARRRRRGARGAARRHRELLGDRRGSPNRSTN